MLEIFWCKSGRKPNSNWSLIIKEMSKLYRQVLAQVLFPGSSPGPAIFSHTSSSFHVHQLPNDIWKKETLFSFELLLKGRKRLSQETSFPKCLNNPCFAYHWPQMKQNKSNNRRKKSIWGVGEEIKSTGTWNNHEDLYIIKIFYFNKELQPWGKY